MWKIQAMKDKAVKGLIHEEERRQRGTLNLIASENYVSRDVREALASVFTNKYAEGYPHARYYGGSSVADKLEDLTKVRALELFKLSPKTWSVNVQPYSGSPANLAVLHALVCPGEKIMAMALDMGGHLTHGCPASITGKLWKQISYGVDRKTERIDYDALLKIAKREKPGLIIGGGSAYSRMLDFKKFRGIADAVGALLVADVSHVAGLVAGGIYPSPFPYAHVVTTTTHKTLRGPRAALIFARKLAITGYRLPITNTAKTRSKGEKTPFISELVDKAVFPGLQGGPHLNTMAAIAVALKEASSPAFKKYAVQTVRNAEVLAEELARFGWRVVSGGTDTHLLLVDTAANGVSGKTAAEMLEKAGIIVNKNVIPYDVRKPSDPSGIRLGTAALTTRGAKESDMRRIARLITEAVLTGISPVLRSEAARIAARLRFPR